MKQISSALNEKEHALFQEMLAHKNIKMYAFLKSYVLEEIKKYHLEQEENEKKFIAEKRAAFKAFREQILQECGNEKPIIII